MVKKSRKRNRVLLPKLRKIDKSKKKHHYHIKDPQKKRILAIEEGIQHEKNKTRKSRRTAAAKKKARFNILRIYRRNNDKKGCQIITKDMRYMDRKYKLGKTKKICGGGKNKQKPKKSNKNQKKTKKRKTKKKQFLYNPDDPKKSFDVYIDKNPADTISIKYTTVKDVKNTIKKLEKLYKKGAYSHKRIWQVGMIMKVRLEAMLKHKKKLYPNAKKVRERFMLAKKYFIFLGKRTKEKSHGLRKKKIFKKYIL